MGETETEPEDRLDWLPIPLSRLTEVAPETDQDRVDEPVVVILEGEAEKEEITGEPGAEPV